MKPGFQDNEKIKYILRSNVYCFMICYMLKENKDQLCAKLKK